MNKVGRADVMSSADIEPYIGDIDEIGDSECPKEYS